MPAVWLSSSRYNCDCHCDFIQCSNCTSCNSMTNHLYDFNHCCVCGRWAKMRWCQCGEAAYCNKDCQVSGWPAHKRNCSFRQTKIVLEKTVLVYDVLPIIMAFSRSLNISETFRQFCRVMQSQARDRKKQLKRLIHHQFKARRKFACALKLCQHYYGGGDRWLRATVAHNMPTLGSLNLLTLESLHGGPDRHWWNIVRCTRTVPIVIGLFYGPLFNRYCHTAQSGHLLHTALYKQTLRDQGDHVSHGSYWRRWQNACLGKVYVFLVTFPTLHHGIAMVRIQTWTRYRTGSWN